MGACWGEGRDDGFVQMIAVFLPFGVKSRYNTLFNLFYCQRNAACWKFKFIKI